MPLPEVREKEPFVLDRGLVNFLSCARQAGRTPLLATDGGCLVQAGLTLWQRAPWAVAAYDQGDAFVIQGRVSGVEQTPAAAHGIFAGGPAPFGVAEPGSLGGGQPAGGSPAQPWPPPRILAWGASAPTGACTRLRPPCAAPLARARPCAMRWRKASVFSPHLPPILRASTVRRHRRAR